MLDYLKDCSTDRSILLLLQQSTLPLYRPGEMQPAEGSREAGARHRGGPAIFFTALLWEGALPEVIGDRSYHPRYALPLVPSQQRRNSPA